MAWRPPMHSPLRSTTAFLRSLPARCCRDQPVIRNTLFAGLSGAVVIYGVATKVTGPPGARGYTGAIGT